MFETLAVLVVFFFFIIFGASFYFKLQENSLQKELDKNTQLQAVQIAQKSVHLPELDCSFVNVQRENCVDSLKVSAFANLLQDDTNVLEYFKSFGYSSLSVVQVYPSQSTTVVYDHPKDTSVTVMQIPVLIYVAAQNRYGFGYLEVKTYA